ncbi:olfactory receptor 1-like protein [Lates japonicus]|uniref:Olfactory receptor 1-like protein n=1 Tax=Lates japonicus TaxID=270547 RepID=A0AAD3M397_LATJO|nr:olfactory receptor 1-like protein [Lates japonicus]
MFQVDENYTRVSEFVIVGFPSLHPEYFDLVAWFFFFLYVTTVVGNLLLVVVFALEHSLQKPMYIIMGRMKTFSTCATQGCIISIYYIPCFFVYSTPFFPNLTMTPDKRIATTLFYSLFPPLINPFIYCLRTKEIKQIFRRWVQKRKGITPTKHGQIVAMTMSH